MFCAEGDGHNHDPYLFHNYYDDYDSDNEHYSACHDVDIDLYSTCHFNNKLNNDNLDADNNEHDFAYYHDDINFSNNHNGINLDHDNITNFNNNDLCSPHDYEHGINDYHKPDEHNEYDFADHYNDINFSNDLDFNNGHHSNRYFNTIDADGHFYDGIDNKLPNCLRPRNDHKSCNS